ncbi:xylulokinase [Fistulifera solaris]|jgi:sugar (pentulose or hexulose) kinase|uniref:Xylulokinase n=1 Tax=Fistulifera solaris TaxID=1519565 RepID=A0A1Z5JPD8_FISSO|nr:xylulokinase [Fistulifera solaris]|eukprot:GAX15905.1 xylulokinase [Fistulifera solaris]
MSSSEVTPIEGYIGVDNGTQGLSVVLTDAHLQVLAKGEARYDFVPNLPEGCYEQRVEDWDHALSIAMQQALNELQKKIGDKMLWKPLAIGISGQMHGECLIKNDGSILGPVRLWCDARNADTAEELTQQFKVKVPKRVTCARFLWTCRERPELAAQVAHITTPAGWCAFRLTNEFKLGIGEASGMFPMDTTHNHYRTDLLEQYDAALREPGVSRRMVDLLPTPVRAGEDGGYLTAAGAALLNLPKEWAGIPVAPAEGDQIAALAGSLIGSAGTISCSFGTSVCANVVGDRPFQGVSAAVDQYCAADGAPVNMVWLRNGTTFLNTIVESYNAGKNEDAFATIMPQLIDAPADCGGLLALPFMHDEPGLHVEQGGSALIVGWNTENAKVGNVAKAALLSTMFNLKMGCQILDAQGYPRSELVLTGGLSRTPECGQILADVFNTPVKLLASADEGCSWGAAVLAKYRHLCQSSATFSLNWAGFLQSLIPPEEETLRFQPIADHVREYEAMFTRYQKLIQLQSQIAATTSL